MTTTERVAVNIRTIARGRGISMKNLAALMGWKNVQVLYTRLSGESKMSVDELDKFAEHLSTTPERLLSDPSTLLESISRWMMTSAELDAQAA